jgi:chemotaxis protein histidine kinase CheA
MVHVVRNAVDHGIENPDERASAKKSTPHVSLRAKRIGNELVFEVSDDGRGIDWDTLTKRGAERGLPITTRDERIALLFADGVTSRDSITELSGRGVGMAAVLGECVKLGGSIDVHSERGAGTCFKFKFATPSPESSTLQAA